MSKCINHILISLIFLLANCILSGQSTQIIYLSGTGYDNTIDWQFFCSEGRRSGKWTTIPVPSNWELMGFGNYNYGHSKDSVRAKENGFYRYEFMVPEEWTNRSVNIVFEGVMTDAEVSVNGKSAGPIHQGAYYRFKSDITKLLNFGKMNLLEVSVAKHSANESVNRAERYGDFWIFGGIFRPVYLEINPENYITGIALDAKADGSFRAKIDLSDRILNGEVSVKILTPEGEEIGQKEYFTINRGELSVDIITDINDPDTWTPEFPNLYFAEFELLEKDKPVHRIQERFGFRTIEKRNRDGIYLNGIKIKFKGICRHSFWPESGRTMSKNLSIRDALLIKEMNMNAVRNTHYPSDEHFLDACDSLGIMVVDELAGWHDAYDTEVGSKLLEEMLISNRNHPSILIWANGNEGGHNPALDGLFGEFDIQHRSVIHPWISFNGVATEHYRSYNYGTGTYWHGHDIVLPTEFLHGMYDGGGGTGLFDYWELMWNSPLAAGGFLWVFTDEGVVRTDKNGVLDTDGDHAADGVLGPYREKEGSYFAIKKIWSPIIPEPREITADFDGKINFENRYFYTNTKECSFTWKLSRIPLPNENFYQKEIEGNAVSPNVAPGHKGSLQLNLPHDWYSYDVLYLSANDPYGREMYTWSYPISLPAKIVAKLLKQSKHESAVSYTETDSLLEISAGKVKYSIGKKDGKLKMVGNERGEIPFRNGPELSAGITAFESLRTVLYRDSLKVVCSFDEDSSRLKEFTWTFYSSGWAKLHLYYVPEIYDRDFNYMGVNFSYPEELIKGVEWLGRGPYRVWKNRIHGVELGIHRKAYNNTITGISPLAYPEFKGYHANMYWAIIESKEQSFTVATSSEDVFLRLFTPAQPVNVSMRVAPPFPEGDISFLQAIPAMGTKSNDARNLGPSGRKNMFYDFGPYDSWRWRGKQMTLFFNFSTN